ncbi:MAG: deoxynucleoside kinase [Planctomycetes bacterium]|nr:deoxynucleoside kinase [Planctomycetota bacterium]
MFIGVAGIIGAGKSTFTQQLAEHLGFEAAYEPVEKNVYLADFYRDMRRWGAMMQIYLLAKRFEQHQQIVWSSGPGVVQDRTIYEDTIFAQMLADSGHIDARDYATYRSLFEMMKRFLAYPDVIVYLRVHPEVAHGRIQKRARSVENTITMDYLLKLNAGYEKFVSEIGRWTRVVTFDWNEYGDVADVAERVQEEAAKSVDFLRDLKRI